MATAIIPLIAGLAPGIISLITGLVHKHAPVVEAAMGPATGPVKLADVFNRIITDLQNAATAGTIDKSLPPDEMIKLVIQSVVSSLKLDGSLNAPPQAISVAAATNRQISLAAGETLTIVGAK